MDDKKFYIYISYWWNTRFVNIFISHIQDKSQKYQRKIQSKIQFNTKTKMTMYIVITRTANNFNCLRHGKCWSASATRLLININFCKSVGKRVRNTLSAGYSRPAAWLFPRARKGFHSSLTSVHARVCVACLRAVHARARIS